uniref:Uncharacterized protein n=1 Tax=Anguilla anguilla TaxID=7936 RepID=A0A0E9WM42_ANGAN
MEGCDWSAFFPPLPFLRLVRLRIFPVFFDTLTVLVFWRCSTEHPRHLTTDSALRLAASRTLRYDWPTACFSSPLCRISRSSLALSPVCVSHHMFISCLFRKWCRLHPIVRSHPHSSTCWRSAISDFLEISR